SNKKFLSLNHQDTERHRPVPKRETEYIYLDEKRLSYALAAPFNLTDLSLLCRNLNQFAAWG
ncbi:MAG: hypothetical protein J6T19_06995, partial [Paludibacteraceae bacterium]|nr:hypothetical protein [Paludibacteraceae bacterium]